jgi:alpha-L-rhamnosidase
MNLSKRVEADNNHIDVGLLGTKAILGALADNGYSDAAYKLASQETFPSWGWWIVNGATTLYENWPINANSDISMNHIMFGEIGAWFYKSLGGIRPDQENPGFKNIILRPSFVEGLSNVESKHVSTYGEIISNWSRNRKNITYSVTIPPNSTADFSEPENYKIKKILIPLTKTSVSLDRNSDGSYHLTSGKYEILLVGQ